METFIVEFNVLRMSSERVKGGMGMGQRYSREGMAIQRRDET